MCKKAKKYGKGEKQEERNVRTRCHQVSMKSRVALCSLLPPFDNYFGS